MESATTKCYAPLLRRRTIGEEYFADQQNPSRRRISFYECENSYYHNGDFDIPFTSAIFGSWIKRFDLKINFTKGQRICIALENVVLEWITLRGTGGINFEQNQIPKLLWCIEYNYYRFRKIVGSSKLEGS